MGLRSLFKRKHAFFPKDIEGRRSKIMEVHRSVSGNDDVECHSTIDTLLEMIDNEKDVFLTDAYVIYYVGYYKPFKDHNEETAKILADGILEDSGLRIIDNEHSRDLFLDGCNGRFTIDAIVEWQHKNYERI